MESELSAMNEAYAHLIALVPPPGTLAIDWDRILGSELSPYLNSMSKIMQNPRWHEEGDVLSHTKMVCENLIKLKEWQTLGRSEQEALFIAALLHDIGKITSTRTESETLTSAYHSVIGDRMTRTILWKDFGLSGTQESQQFRETVCCLVRYHSSPVYLYTNESPERRAISLAAHTELVFRYTNELLYVLEKADILGRIAEDTSEQLENLELFKEVSLEAGCFNQPVRFPDPFSRYAYLSGRNILPGQELYNDTWGTVILMVGLPGTGKDAYIQEHFPNMPVISLDALREEMNASPVGSQRETVNAARELAKGYLRQKQAFVWNATNIKPSLREKQISLFKQYKAMVKLVFLETSWEEMLRRNKNRKDTVPEPAIIKMLEKLVPPNLNEAHEVEWTIV